MTFTINFQANTLGIHHVGYRTYNDPPNFYNVIDVNVTTLGVQSVVIDVPGNLYCAYEGITYTGYVIADCQDQTDNNGDGIPDIAAEWSLLIPEVADPCQKTKIKCIATPIVIATITNVPDPCLPDGTYTLQTIEVGTGDEVLPALLKVTVTGGVMGPVSIDDGGLYKAIPVVVLPGTVGCNMPPDFNIVLGEKCNTIALAEYVCSSYIDVSEDSLFSLSVNEEVNICGDPAAVGAMSAEFEVTDTGNCHCETCKNVIVNAGGASSGEGKISYQVCWDDTNPYGTVTLISQILNHGETLNLGCIIPDTLNIDEGTLDASPVTTITPCTT